MTWPPPPSDRPEDDSDTPRDLPAAEPAPPPSEYPPPPPPPPPPPSFPPPAAPPPYPGGEAYSGGYAYPAGAVPARKTNTMAIVSLILSLLGLGTGITAPIGAVLGHMARRQIRETGEDGDGLALTGIIVGWTITGLFVLTCCVAAIFFAVAASTSQIS